jgi:hypothetical protein
MLSRFDSETFQDRQAAGNKKALPRVRRAFNMLKYCKAWI